MSLPVLPPPLAPRLDLTLALVLAADEPFWLRLHLHLCPLGEPHEYGCSSDDCGTEAGPYFLPCGPCFQKLEEG